MTERRNHAYLSFMDQAMIIKKKDMGGYNNCPYPDANS